MCGPNVRVLNFHQSLLTFALVPQHDKYVTRNPYLHALASDSPSCSVIQKHRTKGSVWNLIKQIKQIRSKWSGRIQILSTGSTKCVAASDRHPDVSRSQPSVQEPLPLPCLCVLCCCRHTSLSWKSAKNPFVWCLLYHTIRQSTFLVWTESEIYFSPSRLRPRAVSTHIGVFFEGNCLFCSCLRFLTRPLFSLLKPGITAVFSFIFLNKKKNLLYKWHQIPSQNKTSPKIIQHTWYGIIVASYNKRPGLPARL